MKPTILPGCSSFNEWRWKGIFYPEDLPRTKWFSHYCKYFDTYEMNNTFYKFPTARTLTTWYEKAPEGFRFAVKMYKGVTHFKKFNDCERLISEFYTVCRENLKEKLSCVLFQMPPSYSYTPERLELVIKSLDPEFKNAVEFRHVSWWRKEVYDALSENQIAFCSVSYPGLPEDIISTAEMGYVRLHGNKRLFYSGYSWEELQDTYQQMKEKHWQQAFIFFNNTASEEGILNALEFSKMLE